VTTLAPEPIRELTCVEDIDGGQLAIGLDYDLVTVGRFRFTRAQRTALMAALIEAEREVPAEVEPPEYRPDEEPDDGWLYV
jgi:hypothetical protein